MDTLMAQRFAEIGTQLGALTADVKDLGLTFTHPQASTMLGDYRKSPMSGSTTSLGKTMLTENKTTSHTAVMPSDSSDKLPSVSTQRQRRQLDFCLQRGRSPSLPQTPSGSFGNSHLDLVLFSIRTYYTKGNFDAAPVLLLPRLWKDCSDSIYFFKVSDLRKARRLLEKATVAHSADVFSRGSSTALIEILSTLSPVNTASNPDVRKTLLLYLHSLALRQLSRESPILIVLSCLHEGMDTTDWSVRALTCIVDRLCANLDPTNPVRLLSQKRLIALLRRSRDYDGALRDWASALDICFDIVQERFNEAFGPNLDPQCHDECAVWTMEDITKIYEKNGNLELAIAWLKQERISGGIC
ncbi:hypothetical protein CEK26_010505 [Fusarium fujikuroi]|nr:hypothetical protein CEK27_010517 [Fusarium fujikuroi]QGI83788.1 hypothetical protein CEK25_010517 [Fusarium fujikuroi]QGI97436.1 hypothetical protein CEK26_010505 [Fusarium fujikuroi]